MYKLNSTYIVSLHYIYLTGVLLYKLKALNTHTGVFNYFSWLDFLSGVIWVELCRDLPQTFWHVTGVNIEINDGRVWKHKVFFTVGCFQASEYFFNNCLLPTLMEEETKLTLKQVAWQLIFMSSRTILASPVKGLRQELHRSLSSNVLYGTQVVLQYVKKNIIIL